MSFFDRVMAIRRSPRDILVALGILVMGLPLMLAGVAAAGLFMFFFVFPPPVAIPEPSASTVARTSHIYAADGSLLAVLHSEHNREPISIEEMPRHLQLAAVAAEDSRFYEHGGLDIRAIFRAVVADVKAGTAVQGGSTITQQYAKNAFVGRKRTIFRKVQEALVASELERTYSKKKILERYLNTVYMGKGAYGVQAAAKTFFDKPAKDLTVGEAALLVGVIPAPVRFSPYEHPSDAEIRRLYVIDRMAQLGHLSAAEAEKARKDRPILVDQSAKEEVFRYPWFVDSVRRYLLKKYGEARVFTGGLEIQTTLDPVLQDLAEKTVAEQLGSPSDPYASIVSIEPQTGYVRAMVGGRDWETDKYNLAIQGRRQPGSSFKPFVLVAALEEGMLPDRRYRGPGTICLKDWKPDCQVSNFDKSGYGSITVEKATVNSVNTVYAQMILDVGPAKVVDATRRMGIPGPEWLPLRSGCRPSKDDPCRTNIEPLPALALGSEEVTPIEMASAFATLAARGVYREPKVVAKVVDAGGRVLESGPSDPVQALDRSVADNVTRILGLAVTRGTGKEADIGRDVAGKTGTAQNFQNAWFVGYTPEMSTAVWVGHKDANKPLLNVQGVRRVAGGTIPARIWAAYMKEALAKAPASTFADAGPLEGELQLPYKPPPPPSFVPSPEPSPEPVPTGGPVPGPGSLPIPIIRLPIGGTQPSPAPSPTSVFAPPPVPSPSPAAPSGGASGTEGRAPPPVTPGPSPQV